jgi:hypothetical protein
MTVHMLIWMAWFFGATWVENTVMRCKCSTKRGMEAMRRHASFLLVLLLAMGSAAALPRGLDAQDQTQAQDQAPGQDQAQGQGPSQDQGQDQPDPPSRVARLSYIEGSVSFQVSGDTQWVAADPNRPLTTGDNLWADQNSRGEVHIGSTAIRLSSETGISLLNLDDRTAQIQLAQGTIEVHLRHLVAGDAWEFDTPNLAFTLTRGGEYLITTDPNTNTTTITVREGEGTVTGGGDSWDLASGQQYTFTGTDQLNYGAQAAPAFDDFESWCQSRDQLENNSQSAHYVSRDVDGYYDLDNNGTWSEVPDYGQVWIPNAEPAGWAPYQVGHWVWIAPWGWTWVDAEPWGWAPFHYGRWVVVGVHWAWVPGPVVVRPVYAPAVVGFVGGGFGFSVAFGGGFAGVGWFPLGPHDVFIPGYHCSERYVQVVNVTNTRIVNVTEVTHVYNTVVINRNVTSMHYTYASNTRAVTVVSRDTFVNARPVQSAAMRVNANQIQNARVVANAPLAPTRASYVSATARVSTARPPVPLSERPVVAKLPPPSRPANMRTPAYTNDSAPFNQGNRGGAQVNRGSNNGFRPFTPPNRNTSQNSNGNVQNRPNTQSQPPVRFAPPVKAKDENYDVHPPLNHKAESQPKQESKPKSEPKPKSDKSHGK